MAIIRTHYSSSTRDKVSKLPTVSVTVKLLQALTGTHVEWAATLPWDAVERILYVPMWSALKPEVCHCIRRWAFTHQGDVPSLEVYLPYDETVCGHTAYPIERITLDATGEIIHSEMFDIDS